MDNNHPSFAERIQLLRRTAETLRDLAELRTLNDVSRQLHEAADTVMTEVLHMEAAQSRFKARRPVRQTRTQTQRASR